MERYLNRSGNSPITHFEEEDDRIIVWYKEGKSYSYSYGKAGKHHVERMKGLARKGIGLSTYINRNVKFRFD